MHELLLRVALWAVFESVVRATPQSIRLEPSLYWDGVDGPWTSFMIQVGAVGPQLLRLLPSTSLPEIYVIHPEGCTPLKNATVNGMSCKDARGGLFSRNSSTSYETFQSFNVGKNAPLRNFGFPTLQAFFGWDSITLNQPNRPGVKNPNVPKLLIAEMATRNYSLMGLLGLDIRPTYLKGLGREQPQNGLVTEFKKFERIPSLSWAYTAGSRWHGSGSQGSLTLGGYDETRMVRNEAVFAFHEDSEQRHTVWVEDIAIRNWNKRQISLGMEGTNFTTHIDSSRPYIYLPASVYDSLVGEFNLDYDNRTGALIVSSGRMKELEAQKSSISFTIKSLNRDQQTAQQVTITLPFESIVLQLDYPITKSPNETVRYVPIRRATDLSQNVLGRAFFQNAYLISDYERGSFTIHEAKLYNGVGPDPVLRPIQFGNKEVSTLDSWKSPTLSKGKLAGIATGSIIFTLLIFFGAYWWYCRRRKRKHPVKTSNLEASSQESPSGSEYIEAGGQEVPRPIEADSGQLYESPESPNGAIPSNGEFSPRNLVHEMPDTSPDTPPSHPIADVSSGSELITTISGAMVANERNTRSKQGNPSVQIPGQPSTLQPASPIPKTPLEYLRRK